MSAKVETMQEITSPPDFVLHGASYFKLTPEEWDFLRTTVSKDDEEIKKRAFEVQAECGYFPEVTTMCADFHCFLIGRSTWIFLLSLPPGHIY